MVAAILLVSALPRIASGQRFECLQPARTDGVCRLQLATTVSRTTIMLRVLDADGSPVRGQPVQFSARVGSVSPMLRTDSAGIVTNEWRHSETLRAATHVAVAVDVGLRTARDTIVIAPRPANPPPQVQIVGDSRAVQAWFVERQMPGSVRVKLDASSDSACRAARVRFHAKNEGAAASPDTVFGTWYGDEHACYAEARWRLGKEVGEQSLRAEMVGDGSRQRTLKATARSLPRLMTGLAYTYSRPYHRLKDSTRTLRWERTEQGTGIKTAFDSLVNQSSPEQSGGLRAIPLIAVDWAPRLPWRHVRLVVGANPTGGRDEWVVGASLMQAIWGVHRESVPLDFQVIAHFQRRTVVTNADECGPRNGIVCTTDKKDLRPVGLGVMGSVDTFTVLTQLLSAFPRP